MIVGRVSRTGADQAMRERAFRVDVECYSGYRADERPLRFTLSAPTSSRTYQVRELLDRWYGEDDLFFKVRADDGNVYILRSILRHRESDGRWSLEAFRSGREIR